MIRGEVSDSIPTDLIIEILLRLPAKSILRFGCVSKLWRSMLLGPCFTKLFLTRSAAPRLLFAVKGFNNWCFFTSPQPQPQPQNLYDQESSSLSLVLAADFHMKFPGDTLLEFCGQASGFIHFCRNTRISKDDKDPVPVLALCNPSTRQNVSLSPLPEGRMSKPFLGFDPIDKQFKVFYISLEKKDEPEILTLGTRKSSWRKIHCPLKLFPRGEGICINGVLYYLANEDDDFLIVCFDVRSEKFKFIYKDFINYRYDTKLINYKGKLGVITLDYDRSQYPGRWRSLKLYMWVIKDVEKPESSEWSECFSSHWDNEVVDDNGFSIVGVTASGEVVLLMKDYASKPFYIFFFHLERSTIQSVEIQGLPTDFDNRSTGQYREVQVFLDHVENLNFVATKTSAYAASPLKQKPKPKTTSTSSRAHRLQQEDRRGTSINKFDSLRLLDDDDFT